MTKSADIRRLLEQGLSRGEVARALSTSYQFVYQIDRRMKGNPVGRAKAREKHRHARPFPRGARVVHKNQVSKLPDHHGVVISSDSLDTWVAYTYHHPAEDQHWCRFYTTACTHNPKREGKLIPAYPIPTKDLEYAHHSS